MAILFVAQMSPSVPQPPEGITDKHEHFFFYGILGVLALRAFAAGRWKGVTIVSTFSAIAFASSYGVVLEFVQRFFPPRSYEVLDMMADAVGAAVAVAAAYAWSIIRRRTETPDVL